MSNRYAQMLSQVTPANYLKIQNGISSLCLFLKRRCPRDFQVGFLVSVDGFEISWSHLPAHRYQKQIRSVDLFEALDEWKAISWEDERKKAAEIEVVA
ncbi:MAG: hypothetical protein ABIZ04_08770 [Opitutus sp.]